MKPSQRRRLARVRQQSRRTGNMKAAPQSVPTARGCAACPFRTPSGGCRDPVLEKGQKSGRCGDYVWYMRGSKQIRHRYQKPRDRRTSRQLRWRARFGAASRKYSESLTDEQQNACIAAGAKLRCRPRLGPSGHLTGLQYWIRKEYAAKAEARLRKAKRTAQVPQCQRLAETPTSQVPQPQRVTLSTSYPPQGPASSSPDPHQCHAPRAGRKEGRRTNAEGRRRKARTAMEARPNRLLERPSRERHQPSSWARGQAAARKSGPLRTSRALRPRRCVGGGRAAGVETAWRWQRSAVQWERRPPELAVPPSRAPKSPES